MGFVKLVLARCVVSDEFGAWTENINELDCKSGGSTWYENHGSHHHTRRKGLLEPRLVRALVQSI
jgi:hypothetical protein